MRSQAAATHPRRRAAAPGERMAQFVALIQSNATLTRCQLHRLDRAVDLGVRAGKVVGFGYFENGKVLLRKRPGHDRGLSMEDLAGDVKSEVVFATCHRAGPGGFREEDAEPYRFRSWLFAGTGTLLPPGERQRVLATLPAFLRRGVEGPSDAEVAFLATLGHIHGAERQLDLIDLDPMVAARALERTLFDLDAHASASGAARPEACAMLSNGRMLAAVRRGRPLAYALLEGMPDCEVCGLTREATEKDPRAKPHRTHKAVVIAARSRQDGLNWIDVPENHLLTVSRSLEVRLVPLGSS